jgi:hypothetical protein
MIGYRGGSFESLPGTDGSAWYCDLAGAWQVESARLVAVQLLIGNRKLSPLVLVYLVAPVSCPTSPFRNTFCLLKTKTKLTCLSLSVVLCDDRLFATVDGGKRGVRRSTQRRRTRPCTQWRVGLCTECRWGLLDPFGGESRLDLVGRAQSE